MSDERDGLSNAEQVLETELRMWACGAGMSALRNAMITEFTDVSAAIAALDESYSSKGCAFMHTAPGAMVFLDSLVRMRTG